MNRLIAMAKGLCLLSLVFFIFETHKTAAAAQGLPETEYEEPDHEIEKKTYPLTLHLDRKVESGNREINLYFMNEMAVPYVAMTEYLPFVGSLYEDKERGISAITYQFTFSGNSLMIARRTDNDQDEMLVNADRELVSFNDLDTFVKVPDDVSLQGLVNIGETGIGGVSGLLKDTGRSYDRYGKNIEFDLSAYSIDLVVQDGECYMPLQTANDILVARNDLLVLFNGKEVLVCEYGYDDLDDFYSAAADSDMKEAFDPSGNAEASRDFTTFNYNELCFLLDQFYGLKKEHSITSFDELFMETDLGMDIVDPDPKAFSSALKKLLKKYLDDLHSSFIRGAYLSEKTPDDDDSDEEEDEKKSSTLSEMGFSSSEAMANRIINEYYRAKYNPELHEEDENGNLKEVYSYVEVGDTAIITFDNFCDNKEDYYKDADLENPQDTIELVAYAHSQITREGSPIRNVVLDLSCNKGGSADPAAFTAAWFQRSARFAVRDTLTNAQSICIYYADINLDGEFDKKDYLSGVNLYCLISGNSFSCANLVAAACKGSNNITLLGRRSGGGSCVVLPCSTANGTIFQISGTKQVSTVMNGSFYNIDQGVEPDFVLSKMETMYDREKLVEYIHSLP